MANELKITTSMKLANGDLDSFTVASRTQSITQNTAAPARVDGTQTIGTTEEAIVVTDLTTNGWAYFRNRDATNYVTIGVKPAATYYPVLRLKANEGCVVRLEPAITHYAKADTAAVILERLIIDD